MDRWENIYKASYSAQNMELFIYYQFTLKEQHKSQFLYKVLL